MSHSDCRIRTRSCGKVPTDGNHLVAHFAGHECALHWSRWRS